MGHFTIERAAPFILAGVFLLLMGLESVFPLRARKRRIPGRWWINLVVAGSAYMTGVYVLKPAAFRIMGWTSANSIGLVHWAGLTPTWRFIASFLLMDLTFYYWHLANHEAPVLWRFHNVHHIDPDMDVSTSFRFHFVEVLYSTAFRAIQAIFIGVSLGHYVIYELIFQCCTMFHHSNMKLPVKVERVINLVFVTPRMHAVHHSIIRNETNSNYSVIFRWWDALHRTLRLGVPQADVTIGVAGYQRIEDNRLGHVFMLPFIGQRDYWRAGEDSFIEREAGEGREASNKMLE